MVSMPFFLFQSTLPVGGATLHVGAQGVPLLISIHAPRGGSDYWSRKEAMLNYAFQSTLPVGGATVARAPPFGPYSFQSTLPVGGATGAVRARL